MLQEDNLNTNWQDITSTTEIELHLMTTGVFFGEFATVQPLLQKATKLTHALNNNDLIGSLKYSKALLPVFAEFSAEEITEYESLYASISEKYPAGIKKNDPKNAENYVKELAQAAIAKGRFISAKNSLVQIKRLDRKISELTNKAVQLLQTADMSDPDASAVSKIAEAATVVSQAMWIKNPLGKNYQHRGVDFHMKPDEHTRKFEHYLEQDLIKELAAFAITYLLDDAQLSEKILAVMPATKQRKVFLRHLSIVLTGGADKHQKYISNFMTAAEKAESATNEIDYKTIQQIMLGRTTGDENYFQYLKELAHVFPLSVLLLRVAKTPSEEHFYLVPIRLKHETLLEQLNLNA